MRSVNVRPSQPFRKREREFRKGGGVFAKVGDGFGKAGEGCANDTNNMAALGENTTMVYII